MAVIDSGITSFHDDLTVAGSSTLYPYGNKRVAKFVDFVNGHALPYDDNGHGSHVAGIVGGNGSDSAGSASKAGMAPKASVIALKVLDANGAGTIADIIEALNWVSVNKAAYNIRVVNLSVGAHPRVLLDRPADARRQEAHRPGHRRRGRGRQPRNERVGPAAIRRDHGARQRTLGAHRRRIEHARHVDTDRRRHGELQV